VTNNNNADSSSNARPTGNSAIFTQKDGSTPDGNRHNAEILQGSGAITGGSGMVVAAQNDGSEISEKINNGQ